MWPAPVIRLSLSGSFQAISCYWELGLPWLWEAASTHWISGLICISFSVWERSWQWGLGVFCSGMTGLNAVPLGQGPCWGVVSPQWWQLGTWTLGLLSEPCCQAWARLPKSVHSHEFKSQCSMCYLIIWYTSCLALRFQARWCQCSVFVWSCAVKNGWFGQKVTGMRK